MQAMEFSKGSGSALALSLAPDFADAQQKRPITTGQPKHWRTSRQCHPAAYPACSSDSLEHATQIWTCHQPHIWLQNTTFGY